MIKAVGHLCPRLKFNLFKFLTITMLVSFSQSLFAHGSQVAYCVTAEGAIRVWIEHWHGNRTITDVANASVVIVVTDGTSITTNTAPPAGVVWDTTLGNLPGCKGPITVVTSCPPATSNNRGANQNNDWVYWDFFPPTCFTNLTIEVREVIGTDAFYFDEPCNQLYPATFVDSFIDCAPPTVTCPADVIVEVDASGCGANLVGLDPAALSDDCTDPASIAMTYSITGATSIFQ